MEAEDLSFLLNKHVKLRKKDNYVIFGYIVELKKDCLIFQTKTAKALISLDCIESVVENGVY